MTQIRHPTAPLRHTITDVGEVPTNEIEHERDLFRTFNRGQSSVLKLLAAHRPTAEIMQAICIHAEESMVGARAVAIRILSDDGLEFASTSAIPDDLQATVASRVHADASAARNGDEPSRFEFADPSNKLCDVWGIVLQGLGGHPLGAMCISRDWPTHQIERAKTTFHSVARLLQLAIEQQRAAQESSATFAAERERIANELHDDPIQAITVLSLMLQRLQRDAPPELHDQLGAARLKADHAINRLRRMLFELHPVVLEDEGLAIATEVYLEETMEPLGVKWSLDDQLNAEPDGPTRVLSFRLIHEALSNVAAHADATKVSVSLSSIDGGISAVIVDDGDGFEPASIPQPRPGHLGISNVRYLAQRVGGRFDIESAPGFGCAVRIWIPLDRQVPTVVSS